jgi:hypothetical protein
VSVQELSNGEPDERRGSLPRYRDIDTIESAEGLVTVFSQRRRDGLITFAFHRVFQQIDEETSELVNIKTAFSPETMMDAVVSHITLTRDRLQMLKEKRTRGELPFPEGGERRRR